MRNIIHLDTNRTSYILGTLATGQLEHLYYGSRLRRMDDYEPLRQKNDVPYGTMVNISQSNKNIGLDDQCLEYSGLGKGDFREPAMELVFADGSRTTDFRYVSHRSFQGRLNIAGLPSALDVDTSTTEVTLRDADKRMTLLLYYCVYARHDVITRFAVLRNDSDTTVRVQRLMSSQLDLFGGSWRLITFDGCWAYERERHDKPIDPGIYVNDSKTGASSNRHNPFVMLAAAGCDELSGECYGSNLAYSGNHAEIVEANYQGKIRLLTGINPSGFEWQLEPGQSFSTPEAILSFSADGFNGLSHNLHRFTADCVVRGFWKNRERPILINNWEATEFDFDARKLIALAKEAAALGIELFVLDDGWFGHRDDDTSSLGDWKVNERKLPGGIAELSSRIRSLGLDFGIWVEPEMISEDSDLYRAHPDWAVATPGREPARGRNQLVLDITMPEVRTWLIETMSSVFSTGTVTYVKWDMNRNTSDAFSRALPSARQGEFHHRYILGLYEVLAELVRRFPHILFESCASGGNRFDLGMLCYMPQIWTSDDTDAFARLSIQGGTSYGYPQSVMGAHVSASPNMQTLRATTIETRFNVAAFGLLGYELDLTILSSFDKKAIAGQIAFYKENRALLQFGQFWRVPNRLDSDKTLWAVVSADGSEAIVGLFQGAARVGRGQDIITVPGLDTEPSFAVTGRTQYINVQAFGNLVNRVLPIKIRWDGIVHTVLSSHYLFKMAEEAYVANGDLLSAYGIKLIQQFSGTGYNDRVRIFSDYGSRLYTVRAIHAAPETPESAK
ncbi:MAG TPA: alpha-galactosidase [bacterium]|nr:alpha-galactosidase [bacterium]